MTGPVDHVSDGETVVAIANGHPLLASITGTGCMSTRAHRLLPRRRPRRPLDAAVGGARRLRRRRRGRRAASARGPGSFHVALYDALAALDPATLDATGAHRREGARDRRRSRDGAARRRGRRDGRAAAGEGADRRRRRARRGLPRARRRRSSSTTTSMRRSRSAPTACTSARTTTGAERARAHGLLLGRSVATLERGARGGRRLPRRRAGLGDAVEGRRRAADRARRACARSAPPSRVPVVAIGGIDASNAAACIDAGAAGVAVDPRGDRSRR